MALRWESSVACWKGFLCLLVLREQTPLEHLRSWLLAIRRVYPVGKRSIASCRRPEEGIPSILWAFVWLWIAKDRPAEAKWLSRPEAEAVEQVLHQEQQGLSQVKNYWAAFRLPRVILLAAQYFFWSIGVYGFVLWLPSIIKAGSHETIGITGLLSAVPYLLAIILMVIASYYSDRTVERKLFVWPFLLAGAIAFYLSYLIGASSFWLSFVLLVIAGGCMYAPYGPFFAIPPEILPSNVAGEAMALINSMGALGSFVGVYVVGYLNGATGSTGASFIFMAVCLVLAVILTIAVRMPHVVVQLVAPVTETQARPA
jgi:sugar phosphate permease